jgi:hypothetical protein
MPQAEPKLLDPRKEEFRAPLLALEGKQVLLKDKFTSSYVTYNVSGNAPYTNTTYRCTGRDTSGKFQLSDVAWVEGDTIWLNAT